MENISTPSILIFIFDVLLLLITLSAFNKHRRHKESKEIIKNMISNKFSEYVLTDDIKEGDINLYAEKVYLIAKLTNKLLPLIDYKKANKEVVTYFVERIVNTLDLDSVTLKDVDKLNFKEIITGDF